MSRFDDVIKHFEGRFVPKGPFESYHLLEDHTQLPDISLFTVPLLHGRLRRKVLDDLLELAFGQTVILQKFGETEVCQFDLPTSGQQDVTQLHVSVNHVEVVHSLHRTQNLPKDLAGLI